jgi:hypothetical protein
MNLFTFQKIGTDRWSMTDEMTNKRIGTASISRRPMMGVSGRRLKPAECAAMRHWLMDRVILNLTRNPIPSVRAIGRGLRASWNAHTR